jgi:hypothetical protein
LEVVLTRSIKSLIIVAVLSLCDGAATPTLAAEPIFFRHVTHQQSEVWLLSEDGRAVYTQAGSAPPVVAARLTDAAGKPFSWGTRPPSAMARWKKEWLLVDGSNTLFRFAADGRAKGTARLPAAATSIFASPQRLWFYNGLMSAGSRRIWGSSDAVTFEAVPLTLIDESSKSDRVLGTQLVFAPGTGDDFLYAHLIGKAIVHRVVAGRHQQTLATAFSRSARRDALTAWDATQPSLEHYSSPVGEIVPLGDGGLLILRNREDIRSANGRTTPVYRLHVDHYGRDHRHLASAVFPEPVRTILRDEGKRVTALTLTGKVVSSAWQKPMSGVIIPPR